jgi:hypothetical protein
MNWIFIVLLMIFCHIVADYNLQGWLAEAKQKSYWEKHVPYEMYKYKYDYICALIMHSMSWTFMIMLPIAFNMGFNVNGVFVLVFIVNTISHAIIDNMKANKKRINLWQDQIAHMLQIAVTAMIFLPI